MKNNIRNRVLILFLLSVMITSLKAGNIDVWGQSKVVDTLEYRSVGPGIDYAKFELPEYPITAYMLTIDLEHPNNLVETFQGQNQVGKTEAMTSAFNRLSREEHKAIAGVNGNFWIVSGQGMPTELLGVPHSGSMLNGEVVTDPNGWNRGRGDVSLPDIGFAMIDANKKVWVDDIVFNGIVTIAGGEKHPISEINRIRKENELVLFNQHLGNQPTRTDNNGVEVFIKPINGKWSINGDVECVVTRIVADKGANLLEEGESVLSGNGVARVFLEKLSVGEKLSVNMSVQTFSDNQSPEITQMITGNALVMRDGKLTARNYNEEYNSMLYPRTGIGASQDGKTLYLIVIDKMGQSKGASTETMCGILNACGAFHATSMDGGGSAQMMLDGMIVNKPADGRERPVANGWFLFHNAPEDNKITRIEFDDFLIQVPSYSSYTPVILGYNKYGVLVDQNVSGIKLSCSETLGNIDQNHTFVASPNAGTGILTAELNGVTVSRQIEVVAGNMTLRLDSVLIDNRKDYPIEVYSVSGNKNMPIDPKYLEWVVEDETVCEINDGVLSGLKNGRTLVTGILGEYEETLIVNIEMPPSATIIGDDMRVTDWSIKISSFMKNVDFSNTNIPAHWESGAAVNFTSATGRAPYITLTNTAYLYGIPDTVKFVVNIGDIALDNAIFTFKANDSKKSTVTFTTFEHNKDLTLVVPIDQLFDVNDRGIYPIAFDNVKFNIRASDMTAGKAYSLGVKEIILCYKDVISSSVESRLTDFFQIYPNPVNNGDDFFVTLNNTDTAPLSVHIFDMTGRSIYSVKKDVSSSDQVKISTKSLSPGVYFLQVSQNNKIGSAKVIIGN